MNQIKFRKNDDRKVAICDNSKSSLLFPLLVPLIATAFVVMSTSGASLKRSYNEVEPAVKKIEFGYNYKNSDINHQVVGMVKNPRLMRVFHRKDRMVHINRMKRDKIKEVDEFQSGIAYKFE